MLNLKIGSVSGKSLLREITIAEKQWLINLLTHRKSRLRWSAANELGKYKIKEGIDALILALQDNHWLVRLHAVKALGRIGDKKVLASIIERLHDNCPYVRRRVIVSIGQLGDESIIPILLKMVQKDKSVKFYVSNALSNLMGHYAVSALIKASCENERIWESGLDRTGSYLLTPALRFLLKFSSGSFRETIIKALGDYGNESALKDLEWFSSYPRNMIIRKHAHQAFGKIQCRKFEKYLPSQAAG
jgi:HEAT repeat protein